MKTLMFTTDYLPNVGGVAAHVYGLAKAMCEAGHEATLVTNVQAGVGTDQQNGPPRVLRVSDRVRWIPGSHGRRIRFLVNLTPAMLRDLRGYDLVHFHTVDPLSRILSALWRTRPQVATNHTSMFVEDSRDPRRAIPWRRFFRRMDGIVTTSQLLATLTTALHIPPSRVRYLPNGVDPQRFHPEVRGEPCREQYGIRPEEALILCPRRLARPHGCIHLARAMTSILRVDPSARVLFTGDGSERAAVEAELAAAGCLGRAVFAGNIPNSEMPAVYAAADIVVVPSLVEATSISVLEAMATARPVVASRTGGLPALVEDGKTGYLVEPGDETGLAGAVCELLADRSRRARMGELARRRVLREFTWDRIAALTIDAYKAFLARARRQAA